MRKETFLRPALKQGAVIRSWLLSLTLLPLMGLGQGSTTPLAGLESEFFPKKISSQLQQRISTMAPAEEIEVEWLTDNLVKAKSILDDMDKAYIHHSSLMPHDLIIVSLDRDEIFSIASLPYTAAMEWVRRPVAELKQEGLDLSLNEVKYLHHREPWANGMAQVISIKEEAFDTLDVDFRNRHYATDLTATHQNIHATAMASIIAGGGNSSPSSFGVAWAAILTGSDYAHLLPDPDYYFRDNFILVQNHSYGTGIENYYGIETQAYDQTTHLNEPELLHVFSSGNSGDKAPPDGRYAGVTGYANLTGQFKQSKNTLCVGAVDSLDHVIAISSRGPAYDGRIKPEIVAFGQGGTSEAAAIVTGIAAILQRTYLEQYQDPYPPAALIKSLLINTSKDIELPGPDFRSGFGSVRAFQAIHALEEEQFILDSIEAHETQDHLITIPPSTDNIKLTLCWSDPAAEVYAGKSLKNDLDLQLIRTSDQHLFLPWVRNTFPHPDSLALPAGRGVDTINNVEQIEVQHPEAGEYRIRILADKIFNAEPKYALTWEIEPENIFEWRFPTASDPLTCNTGILFRWHSNLQGMGDMEYREVNEDNWRSVEDEVTASTEYLRWITPAVPGRYLVRYRMADTFYVSDTIFISPEMEPRVGLVCPDSILLYWTAIPGAESYSIYRIGNRFLLPMASTTDTFYVDRALSAGRNHYAVAPVIVFQPGLRSYGFDYTTQDAGCYINHFFLQYIQDSAAYLRLQLGSLYHVAYIEIKKYTQGQFEVDQVLFPDQELMFDMVSQKLDQGRNDFIAEVVLTDGTRIRSEVVSAFYLNASPLLVFPNPVPFGITNVLSRLPDSFTLDILDTAGKKVQTYPDTSNPQEINLYSLPPGLYLAVVKYEEGGTAVSKIIVLPSGSQ